MSMKNKKKIDTLNLYNQNTDTSAYMIEISLDDYSELFNGWDASPVKRKGLEPELMDYLEQASTEIPLKEKTELCFYMPTPLRDSDKEARSIKAIINNFRVELAMIEKQIKRNYRRLVVYIIFAIIFLFAAYFLRNASGLSMLTNILIEGFFIGGWFLLWEAFSLFFFDTHEIVIRKRLFQRFLTSKIYFKDTKD